MKTAGHDLVQEPHEAGVHHLHHTRSLIGGHSEFSYVCCLQVLPVLVCCAPAPMVWQQSSLACSKTQPTSVWSVGRCIL